MSKLTAIEALKSAYNGNPVAVEQAFCLQTLTYDQRFCRFCLDGITIGNWLNFFNALSFEGEDPKPNPLKEAVKELAASLFSGTDAQVIVEDKLSRFAEAILKETNEVIRKTATSGFIGAWK